jgi:hypothetical protein
VSLSFRKLPLIACLIGSCSLAPALQAADEETAQNPDWPCEQILVPEIPPAVVWAGPSITGMQESWQKSADVSSLVRRITAQDYDVDNADSDIGDFAAKLDASQKAQQLTLLFAGVIQTLNQKRKDELDDIMRYARGQAARANNLSEELDEIVRLQDDPSDAAKSRLALMEKEMELKQRMFDDREAFIQHLCARPVVIEQKLGTLARTIAYYLD